MPRCGVFVMLCVLLVIAFEFALMHRHDLDQHGFKDHHFSAPSMGSPFGGGAAVPATPAPPRNDAKLPEPPPSVPGSTKQSTTTVVNHQPGGTGSKNKRDPLGREGLGVVGAGGGPPNQLQGEPHGGIPPLQQQTGDSEEEEEEEGYGDMRVAVLVPYAGPGLPLWFDAFADLAAANSAAVDWLIFCEEVRMGAPANTLLAFFFFLFL